MLAHAHSSAGREVGAVGVERLAVFVPSLPHPLLSTVYQCDRCLSYLGRGGSWLGCQVWPAISAVSILELVANSGSSRMSRAPNLHSLRATKLFRGTNNCDSDSSQIARAFENCQNHSYLLIMNCTRGHVISYTNEHSEL